eukprot:TRINITY_DN4917_c0_g1_i1.p1 TRINITY_DN4917_c0_g1~~TRINITY_DN4917_c0_g1_i1.p1  ORF type:complete len:493 (-),score=109.34 TRINITY_DN4917_c0_g1_i1:31-1509(-)
MSEIEGLSVKRPTQEDSIPPPPDDVPPSPPSTKESGPPPIYVEMTPPSPQPSEEKRSASMEDDDKNLPLGVSNPATPEIMYKRSLSFESKEPLSLKGAPGAEDGPVRSKTIESKKSPDKKLSVSDKQKGSVASRKISSNFPNEVQEALIPPEYTISEEKEPGEGSEDEGFEFSAEKIARKSLKDILKSGRKQENNISMRLSFIPPQEGPHDQPLESKDAEEMELENIVFKPIFTYCVLVVLVLVFVLTMWVANWQFESVNVNPLYGPSISVLATMGAKITTNIVQQHEWWRLLTSMFLHAGLIHLGLNGIMLARIGVMIEEAFGFWTIGIIYLMSGYSGAVTSSAMNPLSVGVGASGALYGLVGALLGDFIQNHKLITEGKWMYLLSMILSLLVGLGIGLLPILDNWAHIGGLVTGFLLGLILLTNNIRDERGKRLVSWYARPLTVLAALAVALYVGVMNYLLWTNQDGNNYCQFCRYFDCIPTSYWTCPSV